MHLGTLERADDIIKDFTAVYAQAEAKQVVGQECKELTFNRTAAQKERIRQQLLEQLHKDPHNPRLLYKLGIIAGDLGEYDPRMEYWQQAAKKGHPYATVALGFLSNGNGIAGVFPHLHDIDESPWGGQRTIDMEKPCPYIYYHYYWALQWEPNDPSLCDQHLELGIKQGCTYSLALKGERLIGRRVSGKADWWTGSDDPPGIENGLKLLEKAARLGRADALSALGKYWWKQGSSCRKKEYYDCAQKYLEVAVKYTPDALKPLIYVYHSRQLFFLINLEDYNRIKNKQDRLEMYSAAFAFHRRNNPTLSIAHPSAPYNYKHPLYTQNKNDFISLLEKNPATVIQWLKPYDDVAPYLQEIILDACYQLLQKCLPQVQTENEYIHELRCLLIIHHSHKRIFPSSTQFFAGFSAQQLLTLGEHFLTTYPWPNAAVKSANENTAQVSVRPALTFSK